MKSLNIYQKLTAGFFGLITIYWAFLFVTNHDNGTLNYWYSFLFGLIPLIGGLIGMVKASIWGGLRSALGRAVFFISLGLVLWGFGETIWSYYNFFEDVPAPYPSIADIGFAPSIFFWILGTAFLSVATGAIFAFKKSHTAKAFVALALIVIFGVSYYTQYKLARGGVLIPEGETTLKAILDVAYPAGDFLAVLFAAVVYGLSYKYFGGFYKHAVIYILAGLAVMYVGDTVFSYSTTKGTYYNANWGDLMLSTGLTLITFGVLAFATKPGSSSKRVG